MITSATLLGWGRKGKYKGITSWSVVPVRFHAGNKSLVLVYTYAAALTETPNNSDFNTIDFIFFYVEVSWNGTSVCLRLRGPGSFHGVALPPSVLLSFAWLRISVGKGREEGQWRSPPDSCMYFSYSFPIGQTLITVPPTAGDACTLLNFWFSGRRGDCLGEQ